MNSVSFRKILQTDSHKLFNFFGSLSSKSKKFFQPHPFTLNFATKIANSANSKKRIRVVAVFNDHIIGYAFLNRIPMNNSSAYFGIAVSDSWQGKGIGTKLLKYCFATGKKMNISRVVLNVYSSNSRAISAYKKIGFTMFIPSLFFKKILTLSELIFNRTFISALLSKNRQSSNGEAIWMQKNL